MTKNIKVTDKDITCYKILYRRDNGTCTDINKRQDYTENVNAINNNDEQGRLHVEDDVIIYSNPNYDDLYYIVTNIPILSFDIHSRCIFRCTIPKGTNYRLVEEKAPPRYVTDRIRIEEKLFEKEYE